MGPVLFNIYINDLLLLLQNFCSIFNYADDNTLSFQHKDINVVKANLERACVLSIEWFGLAGFDSQLAGPGAAAFQCGQRQRSNHCRFGAFKRPHYRLQRSGEVGREQTGWPAAKAFGCLPLAKAWLAGINTSSSRAAKNLCLVSGANERHRQMRLCPRSAHMISNGNLSKTVSSGAQPAGTRLDVLPSHSRSSDLAVETHH